VARNELPPDSGEVPLGEPLVVAGTDEDEVQRAVAEFLAADSEFPTDADDEAALVAAASDEDLEVIEVLDLLAALDLGPTQG
jgi:hypothetical protein